MRFATQVDTIMPRHKWIIFSLLLTPTILSAGDWPQILGPTRSGTAQDEELLAKWPEDGPKEIWSVKIGSGYAGPIIKGDKVIQFHRLEDQEVLSCFDVTNGKEIWTHKTKAYYRGGVNADLGPRATPLIADNAVVSFGAAGDMTCVSLADGKQRWIRNLSTDYEAADGYFGAGSSPIEIDGRVLVNIGGRKAGIVALDLKTGKTVWAKTEEKASYSSPTLMKYGQKTIVVFITRLNCVALDPADGRVVFTIPFGKTGPTVNAAAPLVFESQLFISSSYGVGAKLLELTSAGKMVERWGNDESMSSQYSTCVYKDGFLYGTHGREDFANGVMRCVDAKTGEVAWQQSTGVAHTILAGDKMIMLTSDGTLLLAHANSKEFKQLSEVQISTNSTRAIPALSNGRLFLRDNRGQSGKLAAYQVGQ